VAGLRIEGRGRLTSGAGFVGGGIGAKGAFEGMALAEALNRLAPRASIETVI
jgi:hypothetical protein